MAEKPLTRIVRSQAKGQITVPVEFRERLGINQSSFLRLTLRGSKIELTPVQFGSEGTALREFDRKELDNFLEEDKIDAKTAARVRRLLAKS
ncbi:MAG: AbrB/MazE/SpoVT family DNA-binding domain-containing protein [Thermoleophilia bacterium]|nr:AbrB/MazE/SpoVT family DNA-binding domain-containing protein [Thermoleophilia bacterium]